MAVGRGNVEFKHTHTIHGSHGNRVQKKWKIEYYVEKVKEHIQLVTCSVLI